MLKKLRFLLKNYEKFVYFVDNFQKFEKIVSKNTKNDEKRYSLAGVPQYQKDYIDKNIDLNKKKS